MSGQESVALKLTEVTFSYEADRPLFTDLHFTALRGQRIGIIGPNGAGKSTLLLLFNGILKPLKGSVQVLGEELTARNELKIRQNVGLVFQNPEDQLFCPTVYEDVAFGPLNFGLPKDQVRQRVDQALQEVGLSALADRSTLNLSFGEKKLVALATVLAMNPQIVVLDEPSSNLDAIHRRKIMDWMRQNGRTCLITSHDLDLIYDTCQRTVILNEGKIVADGATRQILADRALLEENGLELPLKLQSIS